MCWLFTAKKRGRKKKESLRRSVVFVDITGAVLPIVHDGFFRQKLHPPSFSTQNKDQCDPTSHLPSPCVSVRLSFSLPAFFLLWIRRWLQKTDTLFGTGDLERIMSVERLFSLFFFSSFSILSHASSIIEIRGFPLLKKNPVLKETKTKKKRKLPLFSALVQIEFLILCLQPTPLFFLLLFRRSYRSRLRLTVHYANRNWGGGVERERLNQGKIFRPYRIYWWRSNHVWDLVPIWYQTVLHMFT